MTRRGRLRAQDYWLITLFTNLVYTGMPHLRLLTG